MQSTNNKIKTEPKATSINEEDSIANNNHDNHNNHDLKNEYDSIILFQERNAHYLGLDSEDDTQDLLNPELRTVNIKHENEDYIISPASESENASEQSSYCESEASIITQESHSTSQQGSNNNSSLEEDLEADKREKTLIIKLNDGALVTLTNSKKATWGARRKDKSEFQLYENQVELWQGLSSKTQEELKLYDLKKFEREIHNKCHSKENLGLVLNNGQRIILYKMQALLWVGMEKEEQKRFRDLSEEEFFEKINKKVKESQRKTITLTPNNGHNIEVVLNSNQITVWNKLSEEKQQKLIKLEKEEFIQEINKRVKENQNKTIILKPNNGQNIEVVLNSNQITVWNKLSEEKQQKLIKLEKEEFIQEINKRVKENQNKTIILKPNNGQNIEVALNYHQIAVWNKLNKHDQTNLVQLEKKEFIQEINKKVNENRSKIITLTPNNSQKLEVVLNHSQVTVWNKLSEEKQQTFVKLEKKEFIQEINKKVKENGSKIITLTPNNSQNIEVVLNPLQLTAWNKLSKNEQANFIKLEEEDFIQEINKKVNESQRKTITLTPNDGQNIEVVLNPHQLAFWNKLNDEQQAKLKNGFSDEEAFLRRINQEVKKARREVSLDNGESCILPPKLISVWRRLEPSVQASLRAESSQSLVQALQRSRIQESLTRQRKNRVREPLAREVKSPSKSLDKTIDVAAVPNNVTLEDGRLSEASKGIEEESFNAAESSTMQEHPEEGALTITSEYRLPLKKRKMQVEIKKEPTINFTEEENNPRSSVESITLEPIAKKQKVNSSSTL